MSWKVYDVFLVLTLCHTHFVHTIINSCGPKHIPKVAFSTNGGEIIGNKCSNKYRIKAVYNLGLDRVNNKLMMFCPYSNKNKDNVTVCDWHGRMQDVNKHLLQCNYKPILCKYCKDYICIRKDMRRHTNQCDYVSVVCRHCNINNILRKDIEYHLNNDCPNFILNCALNCSSKSL